MREDIFNSESISDAGLTGKRFLPPWLSISLDSDTLFKCEFCCRGPEFFAAQIGCDSVTLNEFRWPATSVFRYRVEAG